MDFQKILSGKEKVQILHMGFRMKWNKGPQGPNKTSYFKCVEKSCKATMATLGELDGELTMKYHHHEQHNHRCDVSKNIVSATLHEFREEVKTNPDRPVKQLFEEISTKALDSVSGTPSKLDLAMKMPVYRKGMSQAFLYKTEIKNMLRCKY